MWLILCIVRRHIHLIHNILISLLFPSHNHLKSSHSLKTMSNSSSSSKVSCCRKFTHAVNTFGLIIMNILDLLLAFAIFSVGVWLKKKMSNATSAKAMWLVYCCISLGVLMFLISSLSFLSICISSCRCLVSVSAQLATIVAFLCLSLGIACACMRNNVLNYLDDNAEEFNLSENDTNFIHGWYTITNISLFVVAILEFARYYISIRFRVNSYRIDGEFNSLINEEESEYQERHEKRKAEIRVKYNNLRLEPVRKNVPCAFLCICTCIYSRIA